MKQPLKKLTFTPITSSKRTTKLFMKQLDNSQLSLQAIPPQNKTQTLRPLSLPNFALQQFLLRRNAVDGLRDVQP